MTDLNQLAKNEQKKETKPQWWQDNLYDIKEILQQTNYQTKITKNKYELQIKNTLQNPTTTINTTQIYELLHDHPKEFLQYLKEQIQEDSQNKNIQIIITDFPSDTCDDCKQIKRLRIENDHNKLRYITGTIESKSFIQNTITNIHRTCPICGHQTTEELQENEEIKQHKKCIVCQRNGTMSFMKYREEKSSIFTISLTETIENTQNQLQDSIPIIFSKHMANEENYEKLYLGQKIKCAIIVEDRPLPKEKNLNKQIGICLGYEIIGEDYKRIQITPEANQKIQELAQQHDLIKYWAQTLFQAIEGEMLARELLIAQMVGNPQIISGEVLTRGDINILFIGDPSTAKSTLLKHTQKYALHAVYATGGGSSAVGITGGVTKDPLTGNYMITAGAMPRAHNGIFVLDEADKMQEEDIAKSHEGLEQQTITIMKANLNGKLPCKISFLGACNPKKGKIDPNMDVYQQINFPLAFLSRMDAILIFKDDYNFENDTKTFTKMGEVWNGKIPKEDILLFKQYLLMAKNVNTNIHPETMMKMTQHMVTLRRLAHEQNKKDKITKRSLQSLMRLTNAHARANFRTQATEEDFEWAKNTYMESLGLYAIDMISGEIDFQKFETGTGTTEAQVIDIITDLLQNTPDRTATYVDIKNHLGNKVNEKKLDTIIEKMNRKGDIFQIKNGVYKLT